MCGIAGIVDYGGRFGPPRLGEIALAMRDCLAHRGPDDAGLWTDPSGTCALAHRRLAIIDLSAAGHQPMLSSSGQAITFNGEIYNYLELRREMEQAGVRFSTATDTEVLLELCAREGPRRLADVDGMYAFAMWDPGRRRLVLARDAFGKKPLYVAEGDGWFAFASELRAFRRIPGFRGEIDHDAVTEYLLLQYVLAPRAMYRGTRKLPPGTWATVDFSGSTPREEQREHFRPSFCGPTAPPGRPEEPLDAVAGRLERVLLEAVESRLQSDVPLGAFLSGGIDSALVAAMVTRELGRPLRTFSLGFAGFSDSEHPAARRVAERLGTEHSEQVVAPDAVSLMPRIAAALDEPVGDSGCLPAFLLSEFTRRHVTVALSGDGGDELFGGYTRYQVTIAEQRDLWMRLMHWARSGKAWSAGGAYCGHRWLMFPPSDLAGLVPPPALAHADLLVRGWRAALNDPGPSLLKRMQQIDATTYLPGAVLAKVDRMSMAFALEVRCPLLSRRVAAVAHDLGTDLCFRDGVGKLVLRRVAAKYLPEDHLRRPKMGFGLPGGSWSQPEMLAMCDGLVLADDSRTGGVLDPGGLRAFIDRQRRPGGFSVFQIWTLLILELWLRAQEGEPALEGSWGTTPSCFAAV